MIIVNVVVVMIIIIVIRRLKKITFKFITAALLMIHSSLSSCKHYDNSKRMELQGNIAQDWNLLNHSCL